MKRSFTYDFRRNLIKVFCLSTGLAIGLLLVAKVYFEQTYDSSLPDIDRICYVTESVEMSGEYREYNSTPGAVAPGLKRSVPQVESATRIVAVLGATDFSTPGGRSYGVPAVYMADSCFFDVIQTRIVAGNPHDALSVKWKCMIPRSLADRIGGDVLGMRLVSKDLGKGRPVEVGSVYEDFPLNSSFSNCIYLSLSSIADIMYDGRDNWMGNDMYSSYVKLAEGAEIEETRPYIRKMLEDVIEADVLEQTHFNFGLRPLAGHHARAAETRTMNWMLSILALIILGSASLNYLLVVMAQMQWRAREMAVRKCYGTSGRRIFLMVIGESLAFMAVSLVLAAMIVVSLSSECGNLFGVDAAGLLSVDRIWIVELAVCLLLLMLTGVVPAWLYCRTPVAEAFRKNTRGKRRWKLALLSVQFFASSFMFCLLVLVGRQYYHINNADMGYEYENVAMAGLSRLSEDERARLYSEIGRLGCVEGVATAWQDFTSYAAGNNIYRQDNSYYEVNVGDMYGANPAIFDVLGMKFEQGGPFEAFSDSVVNQVVVDAGFIGDLHKVQDFEGDMIVGRRFHITEHRHNGDNEYEIRGVVRPIRKNGFVRSAADHRSAVIFPTTAMERHLYIKFRHLDEESMEKARKVADSLFPEAGIVIMPMKTRLDIINAPVRRFGTSVMIAGIVIIVITVIGLIGYTADEVHRRAKEIAIRKVNGMSVNGILGMFCLDVMKVAVPSLVLGCVAAIAAGRDWLSQFTEQVGLSPLSMLATIIAILALLLLTVVVCCLGVVRSNPVRYLRDE